MSQSKRWIALGAPALIAALAVTGCAGPAGPEGPAGPAGPQGETGPAGPPGDQGSAGTSGSTGATGRQGSAGATGSTGTGGVGASAPTTFANTSTTNPFTDPIELGEGTWLIFASTTLEWPLAGPNTGVSDCWIDDSSTTGTQRDIAIVSSRLPFAGAIESFSVEQVFEVTAGNTTFIAASCSPGTSFALTKSITVAATEIP